MEVIKCPLCSEIMDKQEYDFWKCPVCDCEVWPEEEETEQEKVKAIRKAYLEDVKSPEKEKWWSQVWAKVQKKKSTTRTLVQKIFVRVRG